ncbi:prolyl-tRNA synthetase associated domain-containing protein 1 [Octopus bimaculoides]|uniref:PrdX deacylase domain-containing protein 1 n=1 Tax=Octopus bimaculoides TaxID=37653 RepID=A0A0L8GJD6_OCTBM|nr:prolyl-tRNA synthetase associated domain-containing protein 1 [Octopus bimaculoides]|eukprot:XP_014780857.1 PREDICTED: prolyl-tRNA synthetase associated domain-containing protein 1-like [Octopus bimaculoides]
MVNPCTNKEDLLQLLQDLNIEYNNVDHPPVYTVEEALPHVSHLEGVFAKNLFLRDKKKKLWLFCATHDADIKLNDLAKLVNAPGGFRFADESILFDTLGLTQGSVTIFGLVNDTKHDVKVILDSNLLDGTYSTIYFHPMVNSASTGISSKDLEVFLANTGHKPIVINIPK